MNIAIIFAGGVGRRMNQGARPKQFLELHGKPIIIHTLELFDAHSEIDGIVVSCVGEWVDYLNSLLTKFSISKVVAVVPGGETGQMSIYNGLAEARRHYSDDSVVLVHDGVRPLITPQTVSDNIAQVKRCGSAITTAPTTETFVVVDENMVVQEVPERSASRLAKAPQSFLLGDILAVHEQAQQDGVYDSIDSCTLMRRYGMTVKLVDGPSENIKITTPTDFYIFRAITEARENRTIFGN